MSSVSIQALPANMQDRIYVTDTGCWSWQGATGSKGYGNVTHGGSIQLTHRVAYTSLVGPIPDGLQLDHLCRFKLCCNPDHLEPVTNKVNQERRSEATSHCKHGHELTPENTIIKRRANGEQRNCRECERQAQRRRRAEKAQIAA